MPELGLELVRDVDRERFRSRLPRWDPRLWGDAQFSKNTRPGNRLLKLGLAWGRERVKARKLQQENITPRSDVAPVSRFTGKEEDVEVGLQYFGKRYLSPYLGRWISPDPLAVHAPGNADLNLYAYVSGQVLKAIDPVGLEEKQENTPPPGATVRVMGGNRIRDVKMPGKNGRAGAAPAPKGTGSPDSNGTSPSADPNDPLAQMNGEVQLTGPGGTSTRAQKPSGDGDGQGRAGGQCKADFGCSGYGTRTGNTRLDEAALAAAAVNGDDPGRDGKSGGTATGHCSGCDPNPAAQAADIARAVATILQQLARAAKAIASAVEARQAAAAAAGGAPKLLGQPITWKAKDLEKVLSKHGPDIAGKGGMLKSRFNEGEDIVALIEGGTHQQASPQAGSKNMVRVFDVGRNIGTDVQTGAQTSTMTIVTTPSGRLVTAFPGGP